MNHDSSASQRSASTANTTTWRAGSNVNSRMGSHAGSSALKSKLSGSVSRAPNATPTPSDTVETRSHIGPSSNGRMTR